MQKYSEPITILILFLIQFIDVLDFMVVMPLGPDFATTLNIPESKLGWLAGSYTLAAALSGIMSSTFIDLFERKRAMLFFLSGLILSNIFSAHAWDFNSLLLSRFLAGTFGGPATSLCFAIVADLFSEEKRGTVMGKVMSGFSLAAIFGVPMGLEIATKFGWHASFYMVAAFGLLALVLIILYMPILNQHLESATKQHVTYAGIFSKPIYLYSFLSACLGSVASFMIIPYISPFIQLNMHYPRENISFIYLIGGIGSFVAMHLAGRFIDRTTSSLTTMLANIFILFTLVTCFIFKISFIAVIALCAPFMIGMSIRNVANYTLLSKVPSLSDRAGFMSIVSCVQHLASSLGSISASMIITQEHNQLKYMDIVSFIALLLFLIVPFILTKVEKLHIREISQQ